MFPPLFFRGALVANSNLGNPLLLSLDLVLWSHSSTGFSSNATGSPAPLRPQLSFHFPQIQQALLQEQMAATLRDRSSLPFLLYPDGLASCDRVVDVGVVRGR